MKLVPRTQVPDLSFETLKHGSWKLSLQEPRQFTLLVFYRGHH